MTTPLGPYVTGEIPVPLVHVFTDAAGAALNISGFAAKFSYGRRDPSTGDFIDTATRDATITDGPAGEATYTFDGTEMDESGVWVAELWVGNGTNRFASELFEYVVRASVGTAPAI